MSPMNPIPPPTRGQAVARTVSRHIEAVLLGTGFVLGAVVATVAGLLT